MKDTLIIFKIENGCTRWRLCYYYEHFKICIWYNWSNKLITIFIIYSWEVTFFFLNWEEKNIKKILTVIWFPRLKFESEWANSLSFLWLSLWKNCSLSFYIHKMTMNSSSIRTAKGRTVHCHFIFIKQSNLILKTKI